MSSRRKLRATRLVGFEDRAAAVPAALHRTSSFGRYITVNPMSNEAELLGKLRMEPGQCMKVDCYWNLEGDVHFVQVQTAKYGTPRPPGIYARRQGDGGYDTNFVAVVEVEDISQSVLEDVLRRVKELLASAPTLGPGLCLLT